MKPDEQKKKRAGDLLIQRYDGRIMWFIPSTSQLTIPTGYRDKLLVIESEPAGTGHSLITCLSGGKLLQRFLSTDCGQRWFEKMGEA